MKKNRALLALVPAVILLIGAYFYWQHQPGEDTQLADLQSQMTLVMSSGYPMELATNNVSSINDYLKQKDAPADFALSEPLKHATLTGCAIENWHDRKVSLVCFHTGTDTNASASDTWLFVANRKQVSDAPDSSTPQVSQVNKLAIATWVDGDKLYILGRTGNTADLKKYL